MNMNQINLVISDNLPPTHTHTHANTHTHTNTPRLLNKSVFKYGLRKRVIGPNDRILNLCHF